MHSHTHTHRAPHTVQWSACILSKKDRACPIALKLKYTHISWEQASLNIMGLLSKHALCGAINDSVLSLIVCMLAFPSSLRNDILVRDDQEIFSTIRGVRACPLTSLGTV